MCFLPGSDTVLGQGDIITAVLCEEWNALSTGAWSIYFDNSVQAGAVTALLNSSLFYVFFIAYGDCLHLSDTLAAGFPVSAIIIGDKTLGKLNDRLMSELDSHSERRAITYRRGGSVDRIEYDEYYGARCKDAIDQIDLRLANLVWPHGR